MKRAGRRLSLWFGFSLALVIAPVLRGATYLPLPDTELAQRSPVIARARVLDQVVRLETLNGVDHPFTVTTFEAVEVLKGEMPGVFEVRLPGGVVGDIAWAIPGTPTFKPYTEVILFLAARGETGKATFGLTEFGLSKFEIVRDAAGQSFAVRSLFGAETDDLLSARRPSGGEARTASARPPSRDLDSFLCALRAVARGEEPAGIQYAVPQGNLRAGGGASPQWVNIGGPEPGDCGGGSPCQFRWFWDTGASPDGVVTTSGTTQSNLTDGSNGSTHVQNAVDKWRTVAASNVHYSGLAASSTVELARSDLRLERLDASNVTVQLDAPQSQDGGASFNGPLGCGGGVLGLGGTGPSSGPRTFKGESNYFAPDSGNVTMRKVTCATGYPANVFREAILHELGHTLGLGHPDQGKSTHSTTTAADWTAAVMHSFVQSPYPDTPQTDDIQAIQYYYPSAGGAPCVPDATTFCANGNRFKVQVQWTTAATSPGGVETKAAQASGAGQAAALTADTGYFWFFSANNVEMVIKVVDGRPLNGKFWVFAGGLTNVNVVITVTDTQTGAVKNYVNPQGTAFQPIQDTSAFATAPEESFRTSPNPGRVARAAAAVSADLFRQLAGRQEATQPVGARPLSPDACGVGATTLCLNASRFQVRVAWATTDGKNGSGQAVPLTGDTGYFWFFSSNNVEMVIKVVDGRPLNNRFWVFAGGLTNVNVVITVTDTQTGAFKNYVNPQGTAFQPIQDTSAFPG
jgi:hypothetical protein